MAIVSASEQTSGAITGPRKPFRFPMVWAWPALFVLVALISFCRQPAAVWHPAFVAEDGNIFFKQQYELGYRKSLTTYYAGYTHFVPRTLAAICSHLPLEKVPTGYAIGSLLIAAAAMTFFFAPGFRSVIESDSIRAAVVLTFTVMPNSDSLMRLAYLPWYLLLFIALLTLRNPPKNPILRWLLILLTIAAIWSAPLTIACLPIILWRIFITKPIGERIWWSVLALAIVGFACTTERSGSLLMTALKQPGSFLSVFHAICLRCFCYFYFGETIGHPLASVGWDGIVHLALLLIGITINGAVCASRNFRETKESVYVPFILLFLIFGAPVFFIMRLEIVPDFLNWSERTWLWHGRYFFVPTLLLAVLAGVIVEKVLSRLIFNTKPALIFGTLFFLGWISLHTLTFRLWDWHWAHSWKHYAREIRAAETQPASTNGPVSIHVDTGQSYFDFDLTVHQKPQL